MIHSIEELTDLKGVRVLVRADFNVPIENGVITDPLRIDSTLPTLEHLLSHGARVVIVSHMSEPMASLFLAYEYLKKKFPVSFVSDVAGPAAHKAANGLKNGEALLLENIRRNSGEEDNDPQFAKELASLGEVFVNDAFAVSHRPHASIVGVPKLLPSYAGFQFLFEVNGLSPALTPESPSLAIIGGAKLVTKVALIEALLKKYDHVFVGGALSNDLFVAKGYSVGKSLVSGTTHAAHLLHNSKIVLPTHVVVSGPSGSHEAHASEVRETDTISDIAVSSIRELKALIDKSRFVLWNGPMGNFENGFRQGTDVLAEMIANAGGKKVIGGGDTLASIQNLGLTNKITFVSTAGGAMLDFLANGTLPGIEALNESSVS